MSTRTKKWLERVHLRFDQGAPCQAKKRLQWGHTLRPYTLFIPLILSSLLFSPAVQAEMGVASFGDWQSGVFPKSTIQYALTTHPGEETATGIFCITSTMQCIAILDTGSQCQKDSVIPIMANSAQEGSTLLEGNCQIIHSRSFLVLNEFSAAKTLFENKKNIHFAVPLKNGSYQLIQFSTKGAKEAIHSIMPGTLNKKIDKSKTAVNPAFLL